MKAAIWTLNVILGAFLLVTIIGYRMSYKILKDPIGWADKLVDGYEEGEQ